MRRLAATAAAALLALTPGALAQSLGFGAGDNPIEVSADDGIEWSQEERRFTAFGNAKAVQGEVTVSADTLTALYREENQETEVYRLEAEGSVTIATADGTATGSRASYDLQNSRFILYGAPATLKTATETITASDHIEYDEGNRVATATGGAAVEREGRTLRSERLTARLVPEPNGGLRINVVDAEGDVVLTNGREVVTGEQGRYDAETSIATLSGSVKITRDRSQLNGGYAVVNLETGVSRLYASPPGSGEGGRVKGLLVPEEAEARGEGR